ncbi:MAG: ABC transporter substrate-binding protein [Hyphomicrobiaceae bacterium]
MIPYGRVTTYLGVAAITVAASLGVAQAQVSGDVVKIGVLNDQSGVYSDVSGQGSVVAARMAIEDFGGKVLDKPIELIFADHQNKPDVGASIARQWFDREGVDMVVDVPNSAVALAVQAVAKDLNRVHINTGAATTDLTGKQCSPTSIHWSFDTYALAAGTGRSLVKAGGKTWYFITADYAFGHALERETGKFVEEGGGKVLGAVRHPLNTADFASFLLQAQSSKAEVIGLANAGGDTINAIKQAGEFGITSSGQKVAALLTHFSDVHALTLKVAQGLVVTESFYWDFNDETRAWFKRFLKLNNGRPYTMIHAGTYGGVLHYLKAIKEAGTDEAKAVVAKMKELPVNDFYTKNVKIREDGRVLRPFYLMEVKKPEESKYAFDYYKLIATIAPEDAVRPLAEGHCPFLEKK